MAVDEQAQFEAYQLEQFERWKVEQAAKAADAATLDAATATAAELALTATLVPRGDHWGKTPLWTIQVPSLNASLDVGADSEAEARDVAVPHIARMIASSRPA